MKEFLKLLKERAKLHGFTLDEGHRLREKKTGCCPIVAVARYLKIYGHCNVGYAKASKRLGLTEDEADQIVNAADSYSGRCQVTRFELLKAVGLTNGKLA